MDFKQALQETCFCMRLRSETKEGIIAELLDLMVAAGRIQDREGVLKALLDRERNVSTGMQHGIAVPHAKTDSVEGLVTAIGLKPEGVDFESLDGEPSRVFVMTISTIYRTGPHMQFLAAIGKLLGNPAARQRVLAAKSREEVILILNG